MKGIVLAVGLGLASLAFANSASAQDPGTPVPVVVQPTTAVYLQSSVPIPTTCCNPPIRVYYPACTPTVCAPTVRYVSYRPHSCWIPSCSFHTRVIHRSHWCR
jgi:hypothetical protein